METVKVGVVGCGAISTAYFTHAKNFPILEMAACADLDMDKARTQGEKFAIPKVCSVQELMRDKSIEIVLNLTVPKAHAPIAIEALRKGKHTYSEKPLGINRKEGEKIIKLAEEKKLYVGCAPDTVLGSGIQMARKLIDDGAIGRPVVATAYMMCRGHESWHPNPEFYYEVGGGPVFDMGPYYLTALLNLLGPAKRLNAMASISFPQRTITSEPKKGKKIKVETPTHISGAMEFQNGAVGTMIMSFDTYFAPHDRAQPITIYGEKGTMKVPDPNGFDGPVHIRMAADKDWVEVPSSFVKGYGRAVGLADMAYAIRSGRKARCNGEQALAVLDLMQGLLDAADKGRDIAINTPYERPAPMNPALPFGTLDT
jgi:predicted dehydrogenase